MIDNIVNNLRWKWADHGHGYNSEYTADLMEAADEIERLTAATKGLSRLCSTHGKEVVRLRGLLRESRDDLQGWLDDTKSDGYHSDKTVELIARIDADAPDQPAAVPTCTDCDERHDATRRFCLWHGQTWVNSCECCKQARRAIVAEISRLGQEMERTADQQAAPSLINPWAGDWERFNALKDKGATPDQQSLGTSIPNAGTREAMEEARRVVREKFDCAIVPTRRTDKS
jgi:hypothetical protein